jgi:hypothetical protein
VLRVSAKVQGHEKRATSKTYRKRGERANSARSRVANPRDILSSTRRRFAVYTYSVQPAVLLHMKAQRAGDIINKTRSSTLPQTSATARGGEGGCARHRDVQQAAVRLPQSPSVKGDERASQLVAHQCRERRRTNLQSPPARSSNQNQSRRRPTSTARRQGPIESLALGK